jgi:hypothetical protein
MLHLVSVSPLEIHCISDKHISHYRSNSEKQEKCRVHVHTLNSRRSRAGESESTETGAGCVFRDNISHVAKSSLGKSSHILAEVRRVFLRLFQTCLDRVYEITLFMILRIRKFPTIK